MIVSGHLAQRALLDQLLVALHPALEPFARHPLGRADGGDGVGREGQVEGAIFAAEEAAGRERLQLLRFADALQPLADVEKGGDGGIVGSAHPRDPGAEVRHGDGLRRHIAGVPVILVPRVQDVAQVGDDVRTDERGPVHDLGDVFQPLRELDVVHDRVDGRERTQDFVGGHADLEGGVALGVERLGRRHAAGHPQEDAGVGGGLGVLDFFLCRDQARLAGGQRGQGRRAQAMQEVAASDIRICLEMCCHGGDTPLYAISSAAFKQSLSRCFNTSDR